MAPEFRLGASEPWNGLWVTPVHSPALDALRETLSACWHGLLAAPDMGRPKLHISLSKTREEPPSLPTGPWIAQGLLLWQYDQTFWRPLVACRFRR